MASINPDHVLFRSVFGQPEHAAALLRDRLPEAIADAIDWHTLTRVEASFVPDDLQQRHADLLFRATMRGTQVLLFVLLERRNADDPFTPFDMLRYEVRIRENFRREHPATRLPPIIPLVIRYGDRHDLDPPAGAGPPPLSRATNGSTRRGAR